MNTLNGKRIIVMMNKCNNKLMLVKSGDEMILQFDYCPMCGKEIER